MVKSDLLTNNSDLKKLNRMQMVELLCRMRESMDELTQKNSVLQARADEAEAKCARLERQMQEDAALRDDMRAVLEKIEIMSCSIGRCSEAERKIQTAEQEAALILENAQAEAEGIREGLRLELSQRREAFTKQCEELLRGQEALRRLMED